MGEQAAGKTALRDFLRLTKALADETRLRIVMALRGGELCACQLIALLEMAPSTVSRHLYLLEQAGLVEKRKCGKWSYCRLAAGGAPVAVKRALAVVRDALATADRVARDQARLEAVKAMSLEDVCQPLSARRRRRA